MLFIRYTCLAYFSYDILASGVICKQITCFLHKFKYFWYDYINFVFVSILLIRLTCFLYKLNDMVYMHFVSFSKLLMRCTCFLYKLECFCIHLYNVQYFWWDLHAFCITFNHFDMIYMHFVKLSTLVRYDFHVSWIHFNAFDMVYMHFV